MCKGCVLHLVLDLRVVFHRFKKYQIYTPYKIQISLNLNYKTTKYISPLTPGKFSGFALAVSHIYLKNSYKYSISICK